MQHDHDHDFDSEPGGARALRLVGFWLMVVYGALAAVFVAGEALDDPGGAAGAALVAAWLVPSVAFIALTRRAPGASVKVLAGAALGVVVAQLLPAAWFAFEDSIGPVRAIVIIAVTVGAAFVALRLEHTRIGGMLMMIVAISPVLDLLVAGNISPSRLVVMPVPLVASILLLLAGRHRRSSVPSATRDEPQIR